MGFQLFVPSEREKDFLHSLYFHRFSINHSYSYEIDHGFASFLSFNSLTASSIAGYLAMHPSRSYAEHTSPSFTTINASSSTSVLGLESAAFPSSHILRLPVLPVARSRQRTNKTNRFIYSSLIPNAIVRHCNVLCRHSIFYRFK